MLRALVLALHHGVRRNVSQPNRAVCLVDVLSARAAGAVDTVITNALIVDHTGIYKADVGLKDGRIALSAEDWLRDEPTLDIDAAAGRVYYIRASIDWGVLDVVPRLELIDEARGKAKIAELKQVVPD